MIIGVAMGAWASKRVAQTVAAGVMGEGSWCRTALAEAPVVPTDSAWLLYI